MIQTKTDRPTVPVDQQFSPQVLFFRAYFDQKSPLDELVKEGARRMFQAAIDAEVEAFIAMNDHRHDDQGRCLVVKKGTLPEREVLTGAGSIAVKQGRVRDNSADPEQWVTFTPNVIPDCLCLSQISWKNIGSLLYEIIRRALLVELILVGEDFFVRRSIALAIGVLDS